MFKNCGGRQHFFDPLHRRDLLKLGGLSLGGIGGLGMGDLLRLRAESSTKSTIKSVIFVCLPGGPGDRRDRCERRMPHQSPARSEKCPGDDLPPLGNRPEPNRPRFRRPSANPPGRLPSDRGIGLTASPRLITASLRRATGGRTQAAFARRPEFTLKRSDTNPHAQAPGGR